jgi:tetratricopeptide (TPR) repeat protein
MRSTCKPLLIVAFVGTVIAVPAIAQQPSSGYPPPCEASKVSKGDGDRAHTVFLSGKQFLEEANYDKAISYFKDAYSIDCSVHAILPIIAAAYERKGDKAEAVRALEEYLRRAPNAPDREVVERRIKNLGDQLAREQPSATATPTAPTATASGAPSATGTTESVPAASGSPAPAPTAAVESSSSVGGKSVAPWVLVGVGGAGLVAGGVLLGIGSGEVSGALDKCPTRSCSKDNASAISQGNDGRHLETAGVIVGALGIAAIAGGLIWHFAETPAPTVGSTHLTPMVGREYAGVALDGTF